MILYLSALTVGAGSISRKADFESTTSKNLNVNQHGIVGAPTSKCWSYFLLSDWGKFFNRKTKRFDWGVALNSSQLAPFNQTAPFLYEKRLMGPLKSTGKNYFERYYYTVKSDRVYLCWNYNQENARPDLAASAVVIEFTPAASGVYSFSGKLAWSVIRGNGMGKAYYVIGKTGNDKKFSRLYEHEFNADERFAGSKEFVDLSKETSLQNIKIDSGDKLIMIIAGSLMNYRGLEVYDGDLKISSDKIKNVSGKDVYMQKALMLLDLNRKELAEVKTLYEKGDMEKAFEAYKQILVKRVAAFKPINHFQYWLYYTADADKLLKGILTTKQYGKTVNTTANIGLPGKVQWYKAPADGYNTLVRDITTLHWITKLAEKYQQTGNLKYLNAWQGYWSDFADNWPREYLHARRTPAIMKMVPKNSIAWCDIALYIGWRLENFIQGFNAVAHEAVKKKQIDDINNIDLAKLLVHVATYEAPKGVRWIELNKGVPNQRVHCATYLFQLGVYLNDFKGADVWRKLSVKEMLRSGYLPDGTDMEQSLNYNKGYPRTISLFLDMAEELPESEKGPWLDQLKKMYKYRYYYLHAIAKPDGDQPVIGKNNIWRDYHRKKKYMPGLSVTGDFYNKKEKVSSELIKDFSILPLSKKIKEYIYTRQSNEAPAFTSIYFPYGGYVVQRDGWKPDSLYCFMKNSRAGNGHMEEQGNGLQIAAYGQNLIVPSCGEFYTPNEWLKNFWSSSAAWNTIIVDGYSQDLCGKAKFTPVYGEPIDARYLNGKYFDFAEGKFRGVYDGMNIYKNGTKSVMYDFMGKGKGIDDVTHDRQVIFLRKEKMWIVTDIVNSPNPHEYIQCWLLSPEYKPDMIKIGRNSIITERPGAVNMAMYQFGLKNLSYSKEYGVYNEKSIIGWTGMGDKGNKRGFTPAVDVFVKWNGKGKQVLITVIAPFRKSNPVRKINAVKTGFVMTMADGKEISYSYNDNETEAVLKTPEASLVLTGDGGFELDENGKKSSLIIPKMFNWKKTPKGEVPQYE